MSDVPVISSIVNVVTFGKYTVKDDGYELDINTPKIEGLSNKDLEENLNNTFKETGRYSKRAFPRRMLMSLRRSLAMNQYIWILNLIMK